MNLPYPTIRDLTLAFAANHFKGFNALPYNRFSDSDITSSERWWLCPSKDKLAFKFGKVVVTSRETWVEPGNAFVGFNVEKGLLVPELKGDRYVLKPDWFWNEFIREADTRLEPKLVEAADAVETPLQIVVGCGIEAQFGGRGDPGDVVQLETLGPTLTCVATSGRMTFLKELAESQNCGQLAAALAKLTHPAFGYHWVDLMIGTHFDLNPERSNDLPAAARMLEPFRPWMRSSR